MIQTTIAADEMSKTSESFTSQFTNCSIHLILKDETQPKIEVKWKLNCIVETEMSGQ